MTSKMFVAFVIASFAFGTVSVASGGSESDQPTAEEIIERMVEAHGGMEAFERHAAVHFDHILHMSFLPEGADRWWVDAQIVERTGKRRSIHRLGKDGSVMAFDGERVWSKDWTQPNPPEFMVYFDYYFVFLPWLARDGYLVPGEVGNGQLPNDDRELLTAELRFDPATMPMGKSVYDYMVAFIDPETDRLVAMRYAMGYPGFIEKIGRQVGDVFGPLTHVFDEYVEVEGLLVPRRFHTLEPDGSLAGEHLILYYQFGDLLDESKLAMPEDAVVNMTVEEFATMSASLTVTE